nr:hypothetical protein [Brevundimonas diminuta]
MNFFARAAQRAGDRVLHGLGSHTAKGRLRVGFFEDKLHRDWAVYRGETRTTKSWNNFVEFMHVAYGAELDPNLISTDVSVEDIRYRLFSPYHPDNAGLFQELKNHSSDWSPYGHQKKETAGNPGPLRRLQIQ